MAPDPDTYAIHYRFLETFDESFDYDTWEISKDQGQVDLERRRSGKVS